MGGKKEDQDRLDSAVAAGLAAAAAKQIVRVTRDKTKDKKVLCHYTSPAGKAGILASQQIYPSLIANNPKDAKFDDGQYFSDIQPVTKRNSEFSRIFFGFPFQGNKFSNYVCVDLSDENVEFGREHVHVVRNSGPLNVAGKIVSSGVNQ